jgi:hypothetical protein
MRDPAEDGAPAPGTRTRLRQLAGPAQRAPMGALESTGDAGPDPDLSGARLRQSHEALERALAHDVVENPTVPYGPEEAREFLATADAAMDMLAQDGPDAPLSPEHDFALEAVIATDGSRPSVLVRGGTIDTDDDRLGDWKADTKTAIVGIEKAIAATGRVLVAGDTSEDQVAGTAWMIAPGLAATAKHVVEGAFEREGDNGWRQRFGRPVTLDFGLEAGAAPDSGRRIDVTGVRWASPDLINWQLKFTNLDLAILQLAEDGPPPLTLAGALAFPDGPPQLHVVGFPKRPVSFGANVPETFERIRQLVFGDTFGVKRWSPGEIDRGPGELDGDTKRHVITHDATTLQGNSGAPMLFLRATPDVAMGLHYGGIFERENYGHPTASLKPFLDALGDDGPGFV